MSRFINFTGAALIGSLSLLCGSTARAQFDFDGFVDRFENRVEQEFFGDGNRGRGNGRGYYDDGYYDDQYYDDSHYGDQHDDGHYYNDGYDNGYYDDGHRHYGGQQYDRGHQHYDRRPVIVDDGLPYPGLVSGDFGGMAHMHELAMNVRYLANHVTFDMYYNYQSNPGFDEIYAKCYAFRNLAYAVHDMQHTGQHVELTAALNEMDSLFHQLERDIAGWRRTAQRQIGQGDIRHKMELLEETMHHLLNDAGVSSQYQVDVDATPPAPRTGVIRTQPVQPVQ